MDNINPLVSVVVLNWNGLDNTKLCIESIRNLTYSNIEIIIVDNGSIDGSKKYLSGLKDIIFINNPINRGFTGGHIDGYKASSGEYILLLNNDAVIAPDIIDVALKDFQRDKKVAAVGGKLFHWNKTDEVYNEKLPFYSFQKISPFSAEANTQTTDTGKTQEVNNVSGACLFVKRSVVEKVGYLEDSFFAYYEECDLIARMKQAGYRVLYNPKIKLWHKDGASTKDNPYFFYYMMFRNRCYFAVRNFDMYFLLRFFKSYYKAWLRSTIIYFTPKGTKSNQHRAQFIAGMYATIMIPKLLSQRHAIKKITGQQVSYNEVALLESMDVSLIVDVEASRINPATLDELITKLTPLIKEVVLIAPKNYKGKLDALYNIEYPVKVTKASLVSTAISSMTLGALVSNTEYIVFFEDSSAFKNIEKLNRLLPNMAKYGIDFGYVDSATIKTRLFCATRHSYIKSGGVINTIALFDYLQLNKIEVARLNNHDLSLLHRKIFMLRKGHLLILKFSKYAKRSMIFGKLSKLLSWLLSPKASIAHKFKNSSLAIFSLLTLNKAALKKISKQVNHDLSIGSLDKYNPAVNIKQLMDIPVFIISRDRHTYLKNTVNWLKQSKFTNIYILDNDSAYPPLIQFLDECDLQVFNFSKNYGQTVPWESGALEIIAKNQFFIVTDPDLAPTKDTPTEFLPYFFDLLKKYPEYVKVGFGLKIDDIPEHYPLKKNVIEWESQFWKDEIETGVYSAGVDTTFALYQPNIDYIINPSLRTGAPFVLRHLPWYADPKKIDEEDIFYRNHLDSSVNSWDTDELHERYEKEMERLRKSQ